MLNKKKYCATYDAFASARLAGLKFIGETGMVNNDSDKSISARFYESEIDDDQLFCLVYVMPKYGPYIFGNPYGQAQATASVKRGPSTNSIDPFTHAFTAALKVAGITFKDNKNELDIIDMMDEITQFTYPHYRHHIYEVWA